MATTTTTTVHAIVVPGQMTNRAQLARGILQEIVAEAREGDVAAVNDAFKRLRAAITRFEYAAMLVAENNKED